MEHETYDVYMMALNVLCKTQDCHEPADLRLIRRQTRETIYFCGIHALEKLQKTNVHSQLCIKFNSVSGSGNGGFVDEPHKNGNLLREGRLGTQTTKSSEADNLMSGVQSDQAQSIASALVRYPAKSLA